MAALSLEFSRMYVSSPTEGIEEVALSDKTAASDQTANSAKAPVVPVLAKLATQKSESEEKENQAFVSCAASAQAKKVEKIQKSILTTARITHRKNCMFLKGVLEEWLRKAKAKEEVAESSLGVSQERQDIAGDSREIINTLCVRFPVKVSRTVPYVAYDTAGKVQGIALMEFEKESIPKLQLLATSPDNIALFDTDKVIRGVGSALMHHIVMDIHKKKDFQDLVLEALESSAPFYKKMGFEKSKGKAEFNDTIPMVLHSRKMAVLLESLKEKGTPCAKEPELAKIAK